MWGPSEKGEWEKSKGIGADGEKGRKVKEPKIEWGNLRLKVGGICARF